MVNVTWDINYTSIGYLYCNPDLAKTHQRIMVSTLNIPLCVTAFLGNMLIIVALQKPLRCLHPPSKLLLGCLASTDFCVGFISQPLFVGFLMSMEHSKNCRYVVTFGFITALLLGAVSLLTLTAISVDRLLALRLGLRYRQVVTLKRVWVVVVTLWLSSTAIAMTFFYSFRIVAVVTGVVVSLCTVITTFCYTKIYSILRHHQTAVQQHVHPAQPNGREGENPMNMARYKKTVSSALWVQLTLIACYLPLNIVMAIFSISGSVPSSLAITWAVASSLAYLNSSLNPFLCCWKIREVRQAAKDTIRQLWCFSQLLPTV